MIDHQYIKVEFDKNYHKYGITVLPEPESPLEGLKDYPVGHDKIPMVVGKNDDGYFVIAETAGRCVARILNAINNHIKEWVLKDNL